MDLPALSINIHWVANFLTANYKYSLTPLLVFLCTFKTFFRSQYLGVKLLKPWIVTHSVLADITNLFLKTVVPIYTLSSESEFPLPSYLFKLGIIQLLNTCHSNGCTLFSYSFPFPFPNYLGRMSMFHMLTGHWVSSSLS